MDDKLERLAWYQQQCFLGRILCARPLLKCASGHSQLAAPSLFLALVSHPVHTFRPHLLFTVAPPPPPTPFVPWQGGRQRFFGAPGSAAPRPPIGAPIAGRDTPAAPAAPAAAAVHVTEPALLKYFLSSENPARAARATEGGEPNLLEAFGASCGAVVPAATWLLNDLDRPPDPASGERPCRSSGCGKVRVKSALSCTARTRQRFGYDHSCSWHSRPKLQGRVLTVPARASCPYPPKHNSHSTTQQMMNPSPACALGPRWGTVTGGWRPWTPLGSHRLGPRRPTSGLAT